MVDIDPISRSLEQLRTAIAIFQAHTDGSGPLTGDSFPHLIGRLEALLDDLYRQQPLLERTANDQHLAIQDAINRILLTAPNLETIAPDLLQMIGEYLGCSFGAWWSTDTEAHAARCVAIWHTSDLVAIDIVRSTQPTSIAPIEGLLEQAWVTREPIWQLDISADTSLSRLRAAAEAGLGSALVFPIRRGNALLGLFEFFGSAIDAPNTSMLRTMTAIGEQISQFMERQRVEQELATTQTHLALILQQMPAGVIIAEAPSGRLILGNAQIEQIFRHPFLHSTSIRNYTGWKGFHPGGRPYRPEEWPMARAITAGDVIIGEEITILRGDGTLGTIRVNAAPIRNPSGHIIAGVVVLDDITAERQAVDHALRLQAVSSALAGALTPTQVADVIITQGVSALDAYAGSLMMLSDDGTGLQLLGATSYPQPMKDMFRRIPLTMQLPIPVCVRTREPIFIENIADVQDTFPDLPAISQQTGSQALAALPLCAEDQVFGALGLSFRQPRIFAAEERTFMLTLAGQCALALERSRLYTAEQEARQRAEAAQRKLALLAQASQILASSLDYPTTLAHVARLALPDLADWSAVALVEADGRLNIVALAHVDPDKEAPLHEFQQRYPSDPEGTSGMPSVVRTGQSQLIPYVTPEMFAAADTPPEQIQMLQEIGFAAYMCVPLRTNDQILGALSFVSADPARPYTPEDLALAEELGRRGAVAIQNAQLYHDAQHAIQVRDEFLTMASHELRTPLTALLGMSHLVQQRTARSAAYDERVQRGINVIARQALRLKTLVDQMFDLSRLHMGSLLLDLKPVDLSVLIQRVVEEVQPLIHQHTVDLICPETPILLMGDESRLEQVLQNIVHNAIKYSPDGGSIVIRVTLEAQVVRIAITDSGIGIPESAHDQVFKRFYRASNGILRNISGLGIGLYIVNEIIQRHAGSITFRSTEGKGTTFIITLPLLR